MDKHIYDKTDKGREEMATRKYQLSAKLRSVLVMVDGNRTQEVLLKSFGPLGLSADHLAELEKEGYIALAVSAAPEMAPDTEQAKGHGPSARERMATRRETSARAHPHDGGAHADEPLETVSAPVPAAAPALPEMSNAERQLAVREFYSQTIKSTLGLRGMMLQLKVEKCAGMDDFRQLRDVYLEAVLKAKGREMALSLSGRLDQLLGFEHGERPLPS